MLRKSSRFKSKIYK